VPHGRIDLRRRRCIGLVGAGEALSAALVRGNFSEAEAAGVFASLIKGWIARASRMMWSSGRRDPAKQLVH